MKIHEIIKKQGKSISFEFFPPKDRAGEDKLLAVIKRLETLRPDFVSVTYGAGGGTRKNTRSLIKRIREETSLNPMPHLTCIGQEKEELKAILGDYRLMGVDNVLALRGDRPKDAAESIVSKDGWCYAKDVVELAATFDAFSIGVACYPEGHMESSNSDMDMFYTKQKIDAGAHFAMTQMFFENRFFYDFLNRAEKIGIKVPIIPGIMPIFDIKKIEAFCQNCGVTTPDALLTRMGNASPEDARRIGREFAIEQCADLIGHGIRYLHFYTMNQAEAVIDIYRSLKLDEL
jgi:methylenetetrahydrofolate reductase (NADPH)